MSGECLGTVTYDPEQDEVTKTGSRVILHGETNSETWGGVVIATREKNVIVRAYAMSAGQPSGPHGDILWPADGIYRVCPELNSVTLARMQAGLLAVHHLDYLVDALLLGELLTGRPRAVRPKVVDVDARLLAGANAGPLGAVEH